MKVDWFMVIVLAGVAPAGIIFVLLWWKSSGRWAAVESKNTRSPEIEGPRVVVKNDPPHE